MRLGYIEITLQHVSHGMRLGAPRQPIDPKGLEGSTLVSYSIIYLALLLPVQYLFAAPTAALLPQAIIYSLLLLSMLWGVLSLLLSPLPKLPLLG